MSHFCRAKPVVYLSLKFIAASRLVDDVNETWPHTVALVGQLEDSQAMVLPNITVERNHTTTISNSQHLRTPQTPSRAIMATKAIKAILVEDSRMVSSFNNHRAHISPRLAVILSTTPRPAHHLANSTMGSSDNAGERFEH